MDKMNINHIISRRLKDLHVLYNYACYQKRCHKKLPVSRICSKLRKIYKNKSSNPGKRINLQTSSILAYGLVVMHSTKLDDMIRDSFTTLYKIDPEALGDWRDAESHDKDVSDVEEMDIDNASDEEESDLELNSFELNELEAMREARKISQLDDVTLRSDCCDSSNEDDPINPRDMNILEMSESDMEVDDEETNLTNEQLMENEEENESELNSTTNKDPTEEDNILNNKEQDDTRNNETNDFENKENDTLSKNNNKTGEETNGSSDNEDIDEKSDIITISDDNSETNDTNSQDTSSSETTESESEDIDENEDINTPSEDNCSENDSINKTNYPSNAGQQIVAIKNNLNKDNTNNAENDVGGDNNSNEEEIDEDNESKIESKEMGENDVEENTNKDSEGSEKSNCSIDVSAVRQVEAEIHAEINRDYFETREELDYSPQINESNSFNKEVQFHRILLQKSRFLPQHDVENREDAIEEDASTDSSLFFLSVCLSESDIPEETRKKIYIYKLKADEKLSWKEFNSDNGY